VGEFGARADAELGKAVSEVDFDVLRLRNSLAVTSMSLCTQDSWHPAATSAQTWNSRDVSWLADMGSGQGRARHGPSDQHAPDPKISFWRAKTDCERLRQKRTERRIFLDKPRARPNTRRDIGNGVTWIRIADSFRAINFSFGCQGDGRSSSSVPNCLAHPDQRMLSQRALQAQGLPHDQSQTPG
jgi:hypothetical protein